MMWMTDLAAGRGPDRRGLAGRPRPSWPRSSRARTAAADILMILVVLLIAVELVIGVGAILYRPLATPIRTGSPPRPTDR